MCRVSSLLFYLVLNTVYMHERSDLPIINPILGIFYRNLARTKFSI
jgi:hypothetical protein